MAEKSKKFLESLSKENVHAFVKKQMHLAEAMLQEYVCRIPRILEANRRTIVQLRHDTITCEENYQSNIPTYHMCIKLQQRLSDFRDANLNLNLNNELVET